MPFILAILMTISCSEISDFSAAKQTEIPVPLGKSIYSQDSSLSVSLSGYPNGSTSKRRVSVQVSGYNGVQFYAYKIGESSKIDCLVPEGYVRGPRINARIEADMGDFERQSIKVCVIGGSINQVGETKWQPYVNSRSASWFNDYEAEPVITNPTPQDPIIPPQNPPELPPDNTPDGYPHTDGYYYVLQSDNSSLCYPVCRKKTDLTNHDHFGYAGSIDKSCIRANSPKKSKVGCDPLSFQ